MNECDTSEKLEEYFKKVDCYGKENCYFICNTMPSSLFLGMFGTLGGLVSVKKNKNVMGYLLNQNENGICLIPIVAETMTKNRIDVDHYIWIENENIEKITIKNEDIGFKKITIRLKDKTKYALKVSKRIIHLDYHKVNLDKFIEMYKNNSKKGKEQI